nr:hypothetical protein BaRGS_009327 [Batillaria attramentaria]
MTELKMTSLVTSLNPAHLKNAFQWMTETYGLVLQNFDLYKLYPSLKDTGEVDLSEFLMHVRLLPSRPIDRDFVDQSLITNMAEILERLDRHLNTSELRHIAGINNMLLIVVLFWAQIFLQVASYADLPSWLCQAVGVATHFLWLCVVFAQSACTFHMFYTLSFPLRSHAANMNVRVMVTRYFVFVLTSSSVFVVTVLVWQFVAEGNSGYGGSPCYIRKLAVRVTMFVLPLAVTVLLNIAMFVFTIVRLRSPSRARCSRSNRNNLILYIKLSVFTGVTWLLGFLASALASVALIYLFVVLQGCQGV